MIKLKMYLTSKTRWAEDTSKLLQLCAPHLDVFNAGTTVRVCLVVRDTLHNPVLRLNASLAEADAAFRLARMDGAPGPTFELRGSVYVYLRGPALEDLMGSMAEED